MCDSEFARLREQIITDDVFSASKKLREINTFKRDDDTPLQYTLVNIKDWCKNEFEVISQLRINTENRHHRYDAIILIDILCSSSNLMEEREDIIAYIITLKSGEALSEKEIKEGYLNFKDEIASKEMAKIAEKHGLALKILQTFVSEIIDRMIFDGEKLSDLLEPLELSWKDRTKKELALMDDLIPLLKKLAGGREISGLGAYE